MTPYVGQLVDGGKLRQDFNAAQGRLVQLVQSALERTAQQAASYAGIGLTYNHHTYGYRKSITFGVQMGIDGGVAVVRASAPYALFLENGTKRHWIAPRRAGALSWVSNGTRYFSKKGVMHPGTSPRNPMANAQRMAQPLFERLVNEAFVRAFA